MVKSLHCLVSGNVQGVNYRSWAKSQADNLGVKGWVRNLNDGRVEVLAQGEDEALHSFKGRLAQGSTMARVEDVQCSEVDYEKDYSTFELRL